MTVQSTNSSISYVGTGSTTTFAYPFKTYDQTWLKVYVDGTLKTLTTHYTVTGVGSDSGGNIVFGTAPASGAIVYIDRSGIPESQLTDYTANDKFPAETHERALDKLTMLIQRVFGFFTKSISIPNYETSNVTLPPKAQRAGQVLRFNSQGDVGVDSYLDTAPVGTFLQSGVGAIERSYLAKVREVVSVKDFGAVGDGVTNDTDAFNRCAQYIESIGGGVINIPKGTYIVGKQDSGYKAGEPYYRPRPMMVITGCINPVRIVGNGAYLKIANGLHFGSFDNTTGLPTTGINTDSLKRADIGVIIGGYNNASFMIENLTIDGNSPNAVIGGQWGDTGYQCTAYGVQTANNQITEISNVTTLNSCLDGIAVGNMTTSTTPIMPVKLSNIISTGNARQGCSWTGGNMLTAENCVFSDTGKTVNIGKGTALLSSPAAGFDIEAEGGSIIRNGTFINCIYGNNGGAGLVADSGDSADCTFIGNKFYGTTNTSLYPRKPRFLFIKCLIAGQSTSCYTATDPSDRTTFYSCIFSGQESYNGIPASYGVALADYTSQNPVFHNCSFVTTNSNLRLIISTVGAEYNSCYFYQNGSSGAVFSKGTFIGNNQMIVETGSCDLSGSIFIDSLQYSGAVSSNGVDTVGGLTSSTGDTEAYKKIILRSNNGAAWGNQPISSFYAPPSSGDHERGEIVINPSPSSGGFLGWVCVTSGNPGTWKTFGLIS